MKTPTPARVVNAVRSRTSLVVRRLANLAGLEVHRDSEARDYWDDRSARYLDETRPILDPVDPYYQAQKVFLDRLQGMEWTSALEVGCGFGWHLKAIRCAFPERRMAGLDFSFGQLQQARTYLADRSVGLFQSSAFSLPHRDRAFDLVFTSGLLVCIHPDCLPDVMREIARVTKRHVVLLEYAREHIETPEQLAIMQTAAWHGHWFGPALEGAGLHVEESFVFPSFANDRGRVPLSCFRATRRPL